MAPLLIQRIGCKRPLQWTPVARLLSSTPARTKRANYDRLKVHRNGDNKYEWTHSDLSSPIRLDNILKACGALLGGYCLYRSVEVVPVGSVAVSSDDQVLSPGWHGRLPWSPRPTYYSTRQQTLHLTSRMLDSKNLKVFVTVLVQYRLEDPKQFLEQLEKQPTKPFSIRSFLEEPRVFWEQYQDGPSKLQIIVRNTTKATLEEFLSKQMALDFRFSVRDKSVLEMGEMLQEKLQKEDSLAGIAIHRVTVDDLEFPHWVDDIVEEHTRKMWKMEKIAEQRQKKRLDLQRDAKERMRHYVEQELKKKHEEDEGEGGNDSGGKK